MPSLHGASAGSIGSNLKDGVLSSVTSSLRATLGIDGYHLDSESAAFYLLQAKYSSEPSTAQVGPDAMRQLFAALPVLLEPSRSNARSPKIAQLGERLRDAIAGGASVVLQLAAAASISEATRQEALDRATAFGGVEVEFEAWDLETFYREFADRETP